MGSEILDLLRSWIIVSKVRMFALFVALIVFLVAFIAYDRTLDVFKEDISVKCFELSKDGLKLERE